MTNYYQKRLAERQAKQKDISHASGNATAQEWTHTIYEFEQAYRALYIKMPDVSWSHGRYYIGRKCYTKQQMIDKTKQLQAKYHERELLNGLPEQGLD
tara:strand:- start:924 stop:1217 length:294 start_codon:yes stop_codon:yes gene_type:complete